jgi:hypothetical protein
MHTAEEEANGIVFVASVKLTLLAMFHSNFLIELHSTSPSSLKGGI